MRQKRAADEILSEYSFTEGIKKVCVLHIAISFVYQKPLIPTFKPSFSTNN